MDEGAVADLRHMNSKVGPHDDGCKPNPSQTPKSILGFSSILHSPHDFLGISWFPITLHLLNVPPLDLTVDDLHSSTRSGGGSLPTVGDGAYLNSH